MTGGSAAPAYGAFTVADLELALPIEAVREVVPLAALHPLPSSAPGLLGAIDLRGVLLPVLDLARLFERPVRAGGCVVVMLHDGHLLGLRVDAVGGLFLESPGSLTRMTANAPLGAINTGSLRRADGGALLSLLSPAGLCGLPGLPLLSDPEPQRAAGSAVVAAAESDPGTAQLLLMSAAGLPLAIPAMAVHATVASPTIEPSPLAHGHCLGVTGFSGQRIPVVDLLALCRLGSVPPRPDLQAFVLRVAAGLVCLLVERVIDVVVTRHARTISVAASALPVAGLFDGMLPADALPDAVRARDTGGDGHYLMLNAEALRCSPYLNAVVAASRGGKAADDPHAVGELFRADGGGSDVGPGQRSLLIYELMGQVATPAAQIREILPWRPEALRLSGQPPLLALLINRGQAVPVLDLATLVGTPPPTLGRDACVLLVETTDGVAGFVVPRLYAIERSDWESSQPGHGLAASASPCGRSLPERQVVRIGQGQEARLLRVLDLEMLALAWLANGPTLAGTAADTVLQT